jgi:Outer membrane protein beta-barrel domain
MRTAVKPASNINMKNKILLLISLAFSTIAFSQTQPAFGVRAGILSSGMRGDAVDNFNNLLSFSKGSVTTKDYTGFFAGAFVDLPVSENFSIEPALYYSLKGYELDGALNVKGLDFLGAGAKAVLQSQYIDVPVMLKLHFNGLQLFAGPQISYLANANLKTTAGVLGINLLSHTMDATSQFNRWDAGVTGGIGYQFTNGLQLMASYDYGLSKVDNGNRINAYNRGIKLGLGLTF